VSVTGHRDLDPNQEAALGRVAREAIESLATRCRPASIELLTGMADGADQLIARIAVELDCNVHVVLPKPVDVYRAELSEDGVGQLDQLIARPGVAVSTIVDGQRTDVRDPDPAGAYHRLGTYLARSAHVMIALWDGRFERKSGGTLDVLTMYLDRAYGPEFQSALPSSIDVDDPSVDLPGPTAIWIETSRVVNPSDDPPTMRFLVASGVPGVWRTSEDIPPGLTRMLDDLAVATDVLAHESRYAPAYPLLDHLPSEIEPARRTALEEIQGAYMAADRMAVTQQSRSNWSFVTAALIAAAMSFAFLWFAKIDDHLGWLYAYLALFVVGYGVFRASRSRHWLIHHLSFRLLAETLRVRFFTTMLGIAELVDVRRMLALTGVASFPGFGWAAEADRIGVPTTQHRPPAHAAQMSLVRAAWVDDQAGYFERKVAQLHTRHERLEVIQRLLYVLSFITVVVIIAFGADLKTVYVPGHVSMKTALVFLMGLLPLWLTLWELHQGRMATRELLWQFRNQAAIFRGASVRLGLTDNEDDASKIYIELAERSLFETYLWTIHRFHREFTPPSGG